MKVQEISDFLFELVFFLFVRIEAVRLQKKSSVETKNFNQSIFFQIDLPVDNKEMFDGMSDGMQSNPSTPVSGNVDQPPSQSLILSELTWYTSDADMHRIASEAGLANELILNDVTFFENKPNGKSRGICYLPFRSIEAAEKMMSHLASLSGPEGQGIHGKMPVVKFSDYRQGKNPFRVLPRTQSNYMGYSNNNNNNNGFRPQQQMYPQQQQMMMMMPMMPMSDQTGGQQAMAHQGMNQQGRGFYPRGRGRGAYNRNFNQQRSHPYARNS